MNNTKDGDLESDDPTETTCKGQEEEFDLAWEDFIQNIKAQEPADMESGGGSQSDSGCESKGDSKPGDSEPRDSQSHQKREGSGSPVPVAKKQKMPPINYQKRAEALIKEREDQIREYKLTGNEEGIRNLRSQIKGIHEALEWV